MDRRTTILLAEDHRLVREALRDTLAREPDLQVVGEAGDARSALALAAELTPEVIVLDIGLPDLNGFETALRLKEAHEPARIVALSAYSDKRFVVDMLRSGAHAYVTKSAAATDLVAAIRAVAAGRSYFSPDVSSALVDEVRETLPGGLEAAPRLGRREREVVRLIAEGRRSAEIAELMHISVATVEVHRRNLMRKLGLHTVAELTRYAVREGMIAL